MAGRLIFLRFHALPSWDHNYSVIIQSNKRTKHVMVGARQLWLCPIGTFERDHGNILGGFLNWGGGASRLANYRCWRASHTTSGRRRSASLLTFGSWCPHAGMFTFFFSRVCSSKFSLYLSSPPPAIRHSRLHFSPQRKRSRVGDGDESISQASIHSILAH